MDGSGAAPHGTTATELRAERKRLELERRAMEREIALLGAAPKATARVHRDLDAHTSPTVEQTRARVHQFDNELREIAHSTARTARLTRTLDRRGIPAGWPHAGWAELAAAVERVATALRAGGFNPTGLDLPDWMFTGADPTTQEVETVKMRHL